MSPARIARVPLFRYCPNVQGKGEIWGACHHESGNCALSICLRCEHPELPSQTSIHRKASVPERTFRG